MVVPQDVGGTWGVCEWKPWLCGGGNRMYDLPQPRIHGYNRGNNIKQTRLIMMRSQPNYIDIVLL